MINTIKILVVGYVIYIGLNMVNNCSRKDVFTLDNL